MSMSGVVFEGIALAPVRPCVEHDQASEAARAVWILSGGIRSFCCDAVR